MARSYRTDKPRVIAGRRLARDGDGELVLPPILVRRPRKGDVHPLSSAVLQRVLRTEVPIEYLHGLRIRWPSRALLAVWFVVEVLAHELGHHYRNQYRIRRGSERHRRHGIRRRAPTRRTPRPALATAQMVRDGTPCIVT
ncbi:MAG TPA: hypothetical protein VEO54_24670 [Thermoanaerobaculia bacterium]|nr:hypothetical protein [Thermoanaerobaculia bacterium]